MSLLSVAGLSVSFGRKPAVENVSFTLESGERVGLIGESGSGKSVTALAIMGLLAENARVTGSIVWRDREMLGLSDQDYSQIRGNQIAMVFQEPMTALDPTMVVGRQVAEVVRLHGGVPSGQTRQRVNKMLASVGIHDLQRVSHSYPHQLSGGQRQRVLIAMALINAPDLMICDEPTTALDVTVQARVLHRLRTGLDQTNSTLLFISHDLAVVSQMCDRIIVMYDGRIVEQGSRSDVLNNPQHPYTKGLIATADLAGVAPGERLPVLEDFWDRGIDA